MTSTSIAPDHATATPASPTTRLLSASLVVAPLLYLAVDTMYAVRGWDDPTAGVLHVLGAIGYSLVVLAVASWLPPGSRLAAALLLVGMVGACGNAAYGWDTIHVSLGDASLVDQPGAATLIKPIGLVFPLSLALVAWALARLGHRWPAALVLVATLAWPVAHIGNIATLAVLVNVALVVALGSLVWDRSAQRSAQRSTQRSTQRSSR